jgi:hypothetical protein
MDTGQVQAGRSTTRNPAAQLALLASDGATSTTVVGEQLRQLHRLELVPTLATVTMGGNDLLAAYGSSSAGRQAIEQVTNDGQRLLASLRKPSTCWRNSTRPCGRWPRSTRRWLRTFMAAFSVTAWP